MTGRTTNATLGNVSFPAGYKGEAEVSRGLAILATYEPRLSTKTQKEEKRAVMGRELIWAVCGS